ncbi:hypothetical protein KU06062604_150003 [Flavobacterium psychrophilum]|nr:hypothetical protein KU06062604_150003 [Flavobacterium psychrophilum]
MQYNTKAPYIVETYWQIEEVLDGDSIIICNRFTQMKKEIRLYGLYFSPLINRSDILNFK